MRLLLPLSAALLTLACKAEDAQPYAHQSGAYTVSFLTEWDGGDCRFDTVYANFDPVGTTIDADAAAGSMAVSFDEGDQVLDCDLDVNAFSCAPVFFFEQDLTREGQQAVVSVRFGMSGEWTSEAAFSGSYAHHFACEGANCGGLDGTAYGADAAFPCQLSGDFSAVAD
jgi:hypothetical protein